MLPLDSKIPFTVWWTIPMLQSVMKFRNMQVFPDDSYLALYGREDVALYIDISRIRHFLKTATDVVNLEKQRKNERPGESSWKGHLKLKTDLLLHQFSAYTLIQDCRDKREWLQKYQIPLTVISNSGYVYQISIIPRTEYKTITQ
jgi:hypothetical protein